MNKNYGVEILKVIAIYGIVLCHAIPILSSTYTSKPNWYIDFQASTTNIQYLLIIFCRYLGQIGNAIFIVCSGWFLLDTDNVKGIKVAKMLTDCIVISLIGVVVALICHCNLTNGEIFDAIFITKILDHYWFILCYSMFYLIHPFLNLIIRYLSKESHFGINLIFFILYSGLYFVISGRHFYYTSLVGFICVYFYIAYLKKYCWKKFSKQHALMCFVCGLVFNSILILVQNWLGLHFNVMNGRMGYYNWFNNPFILMMAFGLFSFFIQCDYRRKNFVSFIANNTLLIYLIHANYFISTQLLPMIYKYFYYNIGYKQVFVFYLIVGTLLFLSSVLLAWIYGKTIGKLTNMISKGCCKICDRIWVRIIKRI